MQKTKELIVDDSVERDELSNYFSVVTLSPKYFKLRYIMNLLIQ